MSARRFGFRLSAFDRLGKGGKGKEWYEKIAGVAFCQAIRSSRGRAKGKSVRTESSTH